MLDKAQAIFHPPLGFGQHLIGHAAHRLLPFARRAGLLQKRGPPLAPLFLQAQSGAKRLLVTAHRLLEQFRDRFSGFMHGRAFSSALAAPRLLAAGAVLTGSILVTGSV